MTDKEVLMARRGIRITALLVGMVVLLPLAGNTAEASSAGPSVNGQDGWLSSFSLDPADLTTTGRNPYWILEPGYQIVLEGKSTRVAITVLDDTMKVGPFTTRVVEEREWKDDKLVEISRNFYAMSRSTGDLFYFGEDVDVFKGGRILGHEGSWRAFDGENRPGLMMPGTPRAGLRYYQELAPGVAMDRAEIVSLESTLDTTGGATIEHCLEVEESSAIKTGERSTKVYAPGIGVVLDDEVSIVSHGFTTRAQPRSEHETSNNNGGGEG